jgi:3-phenylpropionate/trans-cinnamate dioxygenase alpha subunit
MAIQTKYDIIDMEKGKLDRNVFVDQSIYQDELEQIFGRAWLNIAHQSLIPNPNDFFLSYMGEDPVIVTRDAKGTIHAFLNMCRHRGNRVVRADDGNAKNFMCTYHGWTFSNEGKLVSVPGLQEAYYGELDVENLGLVEARVETYADLIFATWADDAPSLESYLGDARWYTDLMFNRRDCGEIAVGPQKWIEPSNWKVSVDNCSDNYHVPVTHLSTALVRNRFGHRLAVASGHQALFNSNSKHAFVNGHSVTFRIHDEGEELPVRFGLRINAGNEHAYRDFHKETISEVERRLGTFRARRLSLSNHSLFPNTVLGFRLSIPRGPYATEFWHFVTFEADSPEIIRRSQISGSGGSNGVNGLMEQDDQDNWIQVTKSGVGTHSKKFPQELSMGKGHAGNSDPDFPGLLSERYISENNQRKFYQRWQEFMNANSWNDIGIDPIMANFEGTATMIS